MAENLLDLQVGSCREGVGRCAVPQVVQPDRRQSGLEDQMAEAARHPHRRAATIEVIDQRERVLSKGRFGTDHDGYQTMLTAGRKHGDRVWAVEGCNGNRGNEHAVATTPMVFWALLPPCASDTAAEENSWA